MKDRHSDEWIPLRSASRAESPRGRKHRHPRRPSLARSIHGLESRAKAAFTSAAQKLRQFPRPRILVSQWKYTRLPDNAVIRIKPRATLPSLLLSALRALRRLLVLSFLQTKYLIPLEAEAVHTWIT